MPAGATYTTIATTTLGSAQSSVTFSSISGSYTDLVLVIQGNFGSAGGSPTFRANGDSGSNYSDTFMYGSGSSAVSGRQTSQTQGALGYMSNAQSSVIAHFMNYSNSTTNKTVISRGNDTNNLVMARVALWRSTAAITSLEIRQDAAQSFQSGTTFSLYGITAA